jgi:hypothetical protein
MGTQNKMATDFILKFQIGVQQVAENTDLLMNKRFRNGCPSYGTKQTQAYLKASPRILFATS